MLVLNLHPIRKRFLLFAALLCFVKLSEAQKENKQLIVNPSHTVVEELMFHRFYIKDGLPDDRILSLSQTNDGFLWIGTMYGLTRYDGKTFTKFYKSQKKGSLSDNSIFAITKDKANNLWIATTRCIEKFDARTNSFSAYDLGLPLMKENLVKSLAFDNRGLLWIGTEKGLKNFDTTKHLVTNFAQTPFNHPIEKVLCTGNKLWIATTDEIIHYDLVKKTFETYPIELNANAFGQKIRSLLEIDKTLYVCTAAQGIIELPFDNKTGNYSHFTNLNLKKGNSLLDNTEIFDLCASKTGDLWMATGKGLGRIKAIHTQDESLIFYRNNTSNGKSISHNAVYSLLIDKSDVLWCGTESGLNKLDLNSLPFHYYTFKEKTSDDLIRSVYSKNGKSIWFGKELTGFYNYNMESHITRYFNIKPVESFLNRSRSITLDKKGNIVWIGTLGGLLKIDTNQLNTYTKFLPGHTIFALLTDRKGNKWVGTNEGLFEIKYENDNHFTTQTKPQLICRGYVRALFQDSDEKIWIGFSNSGLGVYDPLRGDYYPFKINGVVPTNLTDRINSILEYPKNVIWVATETEIIKISPNNCKSCNRYSVQNYLKDLPENSITGMLADHNGKFWLSTKSGLLLFNPSNHKIQRFLSGVEFGLRSFQQISRNHLLIGTSDGFILFNPSEIPQNSSPPFVAFTSFKIFNKEVKVNERVNGEVVLSGSVATTQQITLNHKNNVFSIGFASLHFTSPEENRFAYKLDGFDKEWTYISASNNSATYTNLDAGTYYFKVKASNHLGNWSSATATLKIIILPPAWKTWWAYIFYMLFIVGVIYVFFKYLISQTKQKQLFHMEHVEKEQLKSLNEMKVRFFTDISHEFRTPLSLIIGPAEDLVSATGIPTSLKGNIKSIYRNCKKLLYLIDELMTFQKLEHNMLKLQPVKGDIISFLKEVTDNFNPLIQKKLIDFRFEARYEHYDIVFDPGKMEMVINNLLFNAIKFSNVEGIICVSVSDIKYELLPAVLNKAYRTWLCINVEDNGKGISPDNIEHLFERYFSESGEKGTGVGLSLTKSLIELHSGVITVQSEPNVKTVFSIYLPIKLDNNLPPLTYHTDKNIDVIADEDGILSDITFEQQDYVSNTFTILVIDDNREIVNYLESVFRSRYIILKASNVKEAFVEIKQNNINLIISDVMMPGINGYELCKTLKGNVLTSHVPVILLSAKSGAEDVLAGLESGADDYVTKPFNRDILKIKVEKLLEKENERLKKVNQQDFLIPKDIATNPLDERFLKKVFDTIEKNLHNEDFGVEDLGSIVAMSRSNLFRKLKSILDKTPIELLYDMRLKKAMDLLLDRQHNISEIAFLVGFKQTASFITAFKRKYGKAPLEYLNHILDNQKKSVY